MGFIIVARREIRLIGGDERQAASIGHLHEMWLDGLFRGAVMTLELDIKAIVEKLLQTDEPRLGQIVPAGGDGPIRGTAWPTAERHQTVVAVHKRRDRHMRRNTRLCLHEGIGHQPDEIPVSGLTGGYQDDIGERTFARILPAYVVGVGKVDRDLAADNRLDAGLGHFLGELKRAEQIARVGNPQRRHAVGGREVHQRLERQCPLKQRIGRMDPQMNEADVAGSATHDAILLAPSVGHGRRPVHAWRRSIPSSDELAHDLGEDADRSNEGCDGNQRGDVANGVVHDMSPSDGRIMFMFCSDCQQASF